MIIAVGFCAMLATQDVRDRERMADIVRRLGDDDFETRRKAQRELGSLPASLVPELERIAAESTDAEVKFSLRDAALPRHWIFLPGTIAQARNWIHQLQTLGHPQNRAAARDVIAAMERMPADAADRALRGLLENGGPAARPFALEAFAEFPPRSAGLFVPLLAHSESAARAAELIILTRDASVVPNVLPIFTAGRQGSIEAGRILVELGAAVDPQTVSQAVRKSPPLVHLGCRLLTASGAAAEETLLVLLAAEDVEKEAVIQALGDVGGPASLGPLRRYFETSVVHRWRDRLLAKLRDPEWALAQLADARRKGEMPDDDRLEDVAATGAPELRGAVLDWLREPGLKIGVQRKLLPLLGAVGRREDGAILVGRLEDRRLAEAAAKGLDILGDPTCAGAIMQAFKRSRGAPLVGRHLLAFSTTGLEEDLLEMLSDPEGYRSGLGIVLELASRGLTSPFRKALWNNLLDGNFALTGSRTRIVLLLSATPSPDDKAWIAKLKAHANVSTRACGWFAELRAGDAAAARPLAEILSSPAGLESSFSDADSLPEPGLDASSPAGAAWAKAVADVWRLKPAWSAGARWLAVQGDRDAADSLRNSLEKLSWRDRTMAEGALAALGGDREMLQRFLGGVAGGIADFDPTGRFVAAASPAAKSTVLDLARAARTDSDDIAIEIAARLTLPDGVPIFRARLRDDSRNRNEPVVVECVAALARLRSTEALPELRLLLRSDSAAHRAAAARALAEMSDRASVARIAELLDDPSEATAGRARWSQDALNRPTVRV